MTVPLPNHPLKEAQKRKEDGRPVGRHVLIDDVVLQLRWHAENDILMWFFILAALFLGAVNYLAKGLSSHDQANSTLKTLCWACIGIAAFIIVRFVLDFIRRSQLLAHLPGPKPRNWITGYMEIAYCKQPHRMCTALAEQYGPIFKFRILCFHVVCITDPVLATYILRSKDFDKIRFIYSFLDPFLGGANLLTGHTNAHWRAVRKGIVPAFSAGNVRQAFGHMVRSCTALGDFMAARGPSAALDMDELLLRAAMDVIGHFGFQRNMHAIGSLWQPDSEDNRNVRALLDSTLEVVQRAQIYARWWRLWRTDVRAGWVAFGRYKGLVRRLLAHMKGLPPQGGSFADLLLRTKDPKTGRLLKDVQLRPEIAALFFAGIDTTGHTGTFCLYTVSQHPKAEAKIVAELQRLGLMPTAEQPQPRDLEYADMSELPYLQAVIKETLRMYPPVGIGQAKVCAARDTRLGGLLLPAGTLIATPHHTIHNVSFNWDTPQEFLPERWLRSGTEYAIGEKLLLPKQWYQDIHLNTDSMDPLEGNSRRAKRYFPFAEGARSCVGQSLAMTSLLATLALLLSRFSFRLADQALRAACTCMPSLGSLIESPCSNEQRRTQVPQSPKQRKEGAAPEAVSNSARTHQHPTSGDAARGC